MNQVRKYLILVTFCISLAGLNNTIAQKSDNSFTIYLVRHSEKVIDKDNLRNPPLTECGQERSNNLKKFLSAVNIDRVYSTNYTRTLETARPTADSKSLEIEIYNPSMLNEFVTKLIESGEDALVVGHSNTTPVLAALLCGEEGTSMHESIYNRIYQVVITGETTQMNIFHTSFNCKNQ